MKKLSPPSSFLALAKSILTESLIWNQAAGGNISVKEGDFLWIKSSGRRMNEHSLPSFATCLDLHKLLLALENLAPDLSPSKIYSTTLSESRTHGDLPKPSMETGFHAFLPKKYVAHFHSLPAIALAHLFRVNPVKTQETLTSIFPANFTFIDYTEPGWPLAQSIRSKTSYSIFFMQNHGVLIQSDQPDLISEYLSGEKQICKKLKIPRQIQPPSAQKIRFTFPDFVVYFSQLEKHLLPMPNQHFHLSPEAPKNLMEVWIAYCWLCKNVPNLASLEHLEVEKLIQSPSEKIRLGQMG